MNTRTRQIDDPENNQGCSNEVLVTLTREELFILMDKGEVARKVGSTMISVCAPHIMRYQWPGIEL